jgi:hypothetical protein
MKPCGYCGRENQDEAVVCRECGTKLGAEIPVTTRELASEPAELAADAPIELQRSRDPTLLNEITEILDSARIPYRRSALPQIFDIGKIGAGEDAEVVVSVPRNQYAAARAAMESAVYLKEELPDNHYLATSTDEELVEVAAQSSEWSPFDVAHARRLIAERGIDIKRIEDKRAEHLRRLRLGKPASKQLILIGWVFSVLGGFIGLGIAWSLCNMKEKTPNGDFFTYDTKSRATGRKMLAMAIMVLVTAVILRLSLLLSR